MIKKYLVFGMVSLVMLGCSNTNNINGNKSPTPDEEKMQETRDRVLK